MALAPPAKKRKVLSLEKKVQVIKTMESNPGMNIRSISEQFSCGKSQITYILKNKVFILSMYEGNASGESNPGMNMRSVSEQFSCGKSQIAYILKNKVSILSMYEANASGSIAHVSRCASESSSINEALYQWYTIVCSKNIYAFGPQLIEKAKEIVSKPNFKGSNGWLEKWMKKYNIKQVAVCGETGDVHCETVDSWKERLPEIFNGYSKESIWNMDETGRHFLIVGLELRGRAAMVVRRTNNV